MMDKKVGNSIPALPHDSDLETKVKKSMERISENIHISANEPSLAVYRLQEHVRRALPPTVARRQHVLQLHTQLQGACYDVEYALAAVHGMREAEAKLSTIQEMLKDSIFHRKQLKYEQTRSTYDSGLNSNYSNECEKREPSMYKRLSSHLTSIDLPDFHDFPDALRETASRVESALQHARSSYENHTKKDKDKQKESDKESLKDEDTHDRSKKGSLETDSSGEGECMKANMEKGATNTEKQNDQAGNVEKSPGNASGNDEMSLDKFKKASDLT